MSDETTPVEVVDLCSACTAGNQVADPERATADVTMHVCGHVLSIGPACIELFEKIQSLAALAVVTSRIAGGAPGFPQHMSCSVCQEKTLILDLEVTSREKSA